MSGCVGCGKPTRFFADYCPECSGAEIAALAHGERPAGAGAAVPARAALPERGGAIGALRVFAWLDLAGGLLGALAVWATIGTRQVDILGAYARTEPNPLGIILGVALLMQGIFLCALFLVIAGAAEDLAAIRNITAE
jgi:hypothetical protein